MNNETKTTDNDSTDGERFSHVTPEHLAQSAFQRDTVAPDFAAIVGHDRLTKSHKKHRKFSLAWFKRLSKKQKILVSVGLALLLALLGFMVWWFLLRPQPQQLPAAQIVEPAPTTEPSRLTGLQVDPEVNKRHVTGVMIENSPDARPQSGLREADIVYEAIAEAGITRFLALYQDTEPKYIGPIRSARPYYLDFLLPFDAGYAHVGGSPDALKQIKQLKVKDLDQFGNPGAYERVSSRYAPHNVYSSIPKLDAVEAAKGYKSSNTVGFARKADETPAEEITAKTINFAISSTLYNVEFSYEKEGNRYLRNMGGKKHVDEKSGKQIASKVVVALVMKKGFMPNGYHTKYETTGSGKMFVFQDGAVMKGTWKKTARDKQFTFTDADGKAIELNPGKTWITIVSDASSVSYKP